MILCEAILLTLLAPLRQEHELPPSYAAGIYKYFGSIVGKPGDVDRDGTPDILVGDPGYPTEKVPPAYWILSGKDGKVLSYVEQPLVRSPTFFLLPIFEAESGPDVDADGVPDLLVRLPTLPLRVLSGRTGRRVLRIDGTRSTECAPLRAHWVSDHDRDGVADVASLCRVGQGGEGRLLVHSGRTGALLRMLALGKECGPTAEAFVEIQDLDGDHVPDFAVLSDFGDPDHHEALRQSKPFCTTTLRSYSTATGGVLWERKLMQSHYWVNAELIRIGDTDADGFDDLAAGYQQVVELVSVRTGTARLRFEIADKYNQCGLGEALAPLGDIDGDKVPDFALSLYDPGMAEGMVAAKSGRDGREIWRVHGELTKEENVHHLGYRLAALGDLDRDGVTDLGVGTDEGPDGLARGLAEVRSGRNGALLFRFRRSGDEVIVTGGSRQ